MRPASCCSVEVMKGGAGFFLRSPRVTERTTKRAPSSRAISARVEASSVSAAFSPSTSRRLAVNSGGSVAFRRACNVQYSTGTKAWISRSRSTISRTATDCTRPALKPLATFRHRSGEIS